MYSQGFQFNATLRHRMCNYIATLFLGLWSYKNSKIFSQDVHLVTAQILSILFVLLALISVRILNCGPFQTGPEAHPREGTKFVSRG